MHRALATVFADHDALVCPTIGALGFEAGNEYAAGIDVAGQDHGRSTSSRPSRPSSTSRAATPCSTVPSGRAANGVPTGVQVVARPYDDVTAFHVGAAAERELGLWADPAWRPLL